MENAHYSGMKQNLTKIILGVIIVGVGLNIILTAAGIEFTLLFDGWWTLPLIIIAVTSMLNHGVGAWNFGMLLLGSWLLANSRGWIPAWFDGRFLGGAAVIGFGLLFLMGSKRANSHVESTDSTDKQEYRSSSASYRNTPGSRTNYKTEDSATHPDYTAVFSGQDVRNVSDQLDGCTLFALFGGLNVDFTHAKIDHDIVIDASAIFGGIDMKFPSDVRVVTKATPLFGGVDNRAKDPADRSAPVVTVRCLAAFGGIDIK
ncbi:MAG: hypothetical protein CVV52_09465 [Spirochaetae bacterium HGW-Spirochaetae-8]|nr:MAG: hypothetical protein CVV52_09465 [Spirochaetae bacterium HGW-Spirochaetae-8]